MVVFYNAWSFSFCYQGLERQGTEFQSDCSLKHFRLQSEITRLVEDLTDGNGDSDPHHYLDSLIFDSSKKLKCAKKVRLNQFDMGMDRTW